VTPARARARGSRAAAPALWRELHRRFAEGSGLPGPGAWRRWLTNVGAGAAAMLVLMALLVRVAQRALADGRLDWETAFLQRLGEQGPFTFPTAVFFQTFGSDITLVILVAATAGIAVWARRPITAASIVAAFAGADLIGRFGWALWDRARPDVLWHGVAAPAVHAFPSGHTSKTLATWGMLTLIWVAASRSTPERILALLLLAGVAAVVPLGRMTMGVHWPSDILGGYVIGGAWLAVLARARRHERRAPTSQTARSRAGDSPDSAASVAR
jgi:undecaprenyl-diphosphatase